MIKAILLTFFTIVMIVSADETPVQIPLSYDASSRLLQSVQEDAILLGTGERMVYVFVDPLCPHSRKFMTMVANNQKMLSKYRYAIYLYSIPRLKSENAVSSVYISTEPLKTLLQMMVEGKNDVIEAIKDDTIDNKVERIALAAQNMNVRKRPFLFILK